MHDAKPASILANLESARGLFRRIEFPGDLLLPLYFAVLFRQYFWWLTDNNQIAWIAAVVFAAIAGWFYISSKPVAAKAGLGLPFWLIAVMPLVFVYSLRVVFPDVSFDVLNYRLLHAERGLRGFLYLPGEFFPTPAPYNPAPDMVTGVFRHALGYRLGTAANLLAMIWVACIVDKLLRPFWRNAWLRAAGVLLAVMTEHLLFEINNYMADLLALPLLLEATYLAFGLADRKNQRRNLVCIALLLGMSVAFKLTNAGLALPVVFLCAYRTLFTTGETGQTKRSRIKELTAATLLCAGAFLLPLVPFSAYLYRETGSAVFPVFNGVFKSAYWPVSNIWDPRWGPSGLWEKLAWPILISFKPERLSELAVYSGRISFGFAVGVVGLLFFKRQVRQRELCFIVVATALLWSASTGYIRYALFVEILAAVLVLACAGWLIRPGHAWGKAGPVVASLLCLGLVFQFVLAGYYVAEQEWSGRPTVFARPGAYQSEARYLLRDRSLRDFLNDETRRKFDRVEVWIVSSMKTGSIEFMLQPNATMIGVNTGEYFATTAGREGFDRTLKRVAEKRMFSLAFAGDLETAIATLRSHGLSATKIETVDLPYYSQATIRMSLIEVSAAVENMSVASANDAATAAGPNSDPAYRAEISVAPQPGVMAAGEKIVLRVKVKNAGSGVWRWRAPSGWMNIVTVGDRWLSADGLKAVNELDSRSALPHDLQPGDETEVPLTVTAPQAPGEYVLEIDMVHEGVTWFSQKGSRTIRWSVTVKNH